MPDIYPTYGNTREFRFRIADLTFPGVVNGLDSARYQRNGVKPHSFMLRRSPMTAPTG